MTLQTEFKFELPKGYVDEDGGLHREGVIRLATAADMILPKKDYRVRDNPDYQTIILFSRVIKQLGSLPVINPKVIEGLFASDLAYLEDLYIKVNYDESTKIKAVCPKCEHEFEVDLARPD